MLALRHTTAVALGLFGSSVSAKVVINNHCETPVQFVQSHNGGCDYGPAGPEACVGGRRPDPWVIESGDSVDVPLLSNSDAVVIKVSKGDVTKISQVEYCASDQRYWDLSDIDGAGAARTGSPFYDDHVALIPSGNGLGAGTCLPVLCEAGKQCEDAYQFPDQNATRVCPLDTGDLTYELCLDQQAMGVLLQRWLPDGARTNFGMESGLKNDASYEGNQNNSGPQCQSDDEQECPTSDTQAYQDGSGQQCQNGVGDGCQTPGSATQPESVPVPKPVEEQTTNNNDIYNANNQNYNSHGRHRGQNPHHQDQKRNVAPSVRPRPRHLRSHQRQGHKRRVHARKVVLSEAKR